MTLLQALDDDDDNDDVWLQLIAVFFGKSMAFSATATVNILCVYAKSCAVALWQ